MAEIIQLQLSDPKNGRAEWVRPIWPREKLDKQRVAIFAELYQEQGPDALPPVVIIRGEKGAILADGVHRICAAWQLGWTTLPAEMHPPQPGLPLDIQALLVAVNQASTGSLPLTLKERKRAALRLLRECPTFSQRQIAKLVGVSHTTVRRWAGEAPGDDSSDADVGTSAPTADSLARAWLKRMRLLEKHKGLSDLLWGDRMGKRLAKAAVEIFGDNALKKVTLYAGWWNEAVNLIKERTSWT